MNKSFLTKVKVALIKQGKTMKALHTELALDIAYNTFTQVLSGSRRNDEVVAKVKERLQIK